MNHLFLVFGQACEWSQIKYLDMLSSSPRVFFSDLPATSVSGLSIDTLP